MARQDVAAVGHVRSGGRYRRWALRVLAVVVVLAPVAGASSPRPAPPLQPVALYNPNPPTGVAVTPDDRQLRVQWTAPANEISVTGYRVYLDDVFTASTATTSVDLTGLINGRTYSVTVKTVQTVLGTTYEGTTASAPQPGTPRDSVAPAAPGAFTASGGDGQVSLSWTANGEPDLKHYELSRDGVPIATVTGTTSYVDGGRTNGAAYTYSLVAVDTSGNSSAPASASATPRDGVAPAAPSGFSATGADGQVSLSWTANGEPDLKHYELSRDGVPIATVTGTTSYVDGGRTNGTTHSYALVAVDTSGNSSAPASASATPRDGVAPAAPNGFAAIAADGQVSLSWTANAEPDIAHYALSRDGVLIATPAGTSHVDAGLVNGTPHTYELVAVDTSGNASTAATATATPTADATPTAPTGVTATPGDRSAVVRWTAAGEPDVVGYRVLAENGSTAAAVAAPTTQATVTGLTNGTTYRFTVVAVDAGGNVSAPSSVVTVVPAGTVPIQGAAESGGVAASADGRYVVVGTRAQREPTDTNTAYELYLFDRTAGTARRIAPLPATATGASDPTNTSAPAISDDGRYVALATTAGLVAGDRNGMADVYRLDTQTNLWSLVSVPRVGGVSGTTAGTLLQTGPSVYATSPTVVLSADGNLVLFYSARSDLVSGDTNGAVDVFAKRMTDGVVTRVSATATGGNLPRTATGPALALTPDGRFALFPATGSSGPVVLYRKTLSGAGTGDVAVVSTVPVAGRPTEFAVFRDAGDVAVSDDGRYVALVTAAKLGTTTPTAYWSTGFAYRLDTATGGVVAMGDGQRTAWEHRVELDPTGRFGFFATPAAELPADGNGHSDHYRRDLDGGVAGALVLVTTDADGRPTTGPTGAVTPGEYGRLLAATGDQVLVTTSQALVAADANKLRDLYAKDLATGAVSSPVG